jgi:hypothetical protein
MSCNCNPSNPVPACAQNLQLGTYAPGKQLNVYFTTATGRVDAYAATTDTQGLIHLPAPNLRMDTPYTVTIAEQSDNKQNPVSWLIGSTSLECITVQFTPESLNDNCFNPAIYEVTLA